VDGLLTKDGIVSETVALRLATVVAGWMALVALNSAGGVGLAERPRGRGEWNAAYVMGDENQLMRVRVQGDEGIQVMAE
jgi:hypothetical protein